MSIFVSASMSQMQQRKDDDEEGVLPDLDGVSVEDDRLAEAQHKRFQGKVAKLRAKYESLDAPSERVRYRILFRSDSKRHHMLDSIIRVQLFGSRYLSEVVMTLEEDLVRRDELPVPGLEQESKHRMAVYEHSFVGPDVGNILAVSVGHDSNGRKTSWFLSSVVVVAQRGDVEAVHESVADGDDVWECPCMKWLSKVRGNRSLYRVLYAHSVRTASTSGEEEPLHVRVSETRDRKDAQTNTTYVEYEMVCESGSMSWTVWLRYSEILDVANRLKKKIPEIGLLNKAFPEKKFLASSSAADTQEERKSGFQQWFSEVLQLSEVATSREMRALLEVPPSCLRSPSSSTSGGSGSLTRSSFDTPLDDEG